MDAGKKKLTDKDTASLYKAFITTKAMTNNNDSNKNSTSSNNSTKDKSSADEEYDAFRKEAREASSRKTVRTVAKGATAAAVVGGGLYYANAKAKGKQAAALKRVEQNLVSLDKKKIAVKNNYDKEKQELRDEIHKQYIKLKKSGLDDKAAACKKSYDAKKDKLKSDSQSKIDVINKEIEFAKAEYERYKKDKFAAAFEKPEKKSVALNRLGKTLKKSNKAIKKKLTKEDAEDMIKDTMLQIYEAHDSGIIDDVEKKVLLESITSIDYEN